jgi:hypothetical protein
LNLSRELRVGSKFLDPMLPHERNVAMPFQRRQPRIRRLTRAQLLTLATWRWAAVKFDQEVRECDVLEQVALYATLATLRELDDPFQLFSRHAEAHPEFSLVRSLAPGKYEHDTLAHDILDTAFWLRWNELTNCSDTNSAERRAHDPDAEAPSG